MTRIGLLSDTHGYLDEKVFKYFDHCDEVWHAGDFGSLEVSEKLAAFKPLKAVYGNIDGHQIRNIHPLHQLFQCEQINVWLTHIGGYPDNYDFSIREEIKNFPPDLFICGHSHILKIIRDKNLNNLLHINPGAAGNTGLHHIRTIVRFAVGGKKIWDVEAIELGERSVR